MENDATAPPRSFKDRRLRRIRCLRLSLACLMAIGLSLSSLFFHSITTEAIFGTYLDAAKIDEWVLNRLSTVPLLGELLIALLRPILAIYPVLTATVVGLIAGIFVPRSWCESIYTRAFEQFDDDTFARVHEPWPFDPLRGALRDPSDVALPWTLAPDGPRYELWKALLALSTTSLEYKSPFWKMFSEPEMPFGWTVLMGSTGSGKSRLAVEIARHLARRDIFGETRRPSLSLRLHTWWKVQVRRQRCGSEDPWDAGWLWAGVNVGPHATGQNVRHCSAYSEWTARLAIGQEWIDKIKNWKPRRPTYVLLDDPLLNDAKQAVECFVAQAGRYAHPVRLVIVNQTAPFELGLIKHENLWGTIGIPAPLVAPVVITAECRMSAQDIRRLNGQNLFSGRYPLSKTEEIRRFLAATRGNPLLVEVGVKWLRDGKSLTDMTESALLTDRVDRVFNALAEAGLKETTHFRAIAVATLASSDSFARKDTIVSDYPLPRLEASELSRIFPDGVNLEIYLPPIRPEIIGDEFVRRVWSQATETERKKLLTIAWRVNARGTLRSSLRIGNRADDLLARDLATGPPENIGIDAVDLAQAYAESAALVPNIEWEAGLFSFGLLHAFVAETRIAAINAQNAFEFARKFLLTVNMSQSTHVERPKLTNRFLAKAILRVADDLRAAPNGTDLAEFLSSWSRHPTNPNVMRSGYKDTVSESFCQVIAPLLQHCIDVSGPDEFHRLELLYLLSESFQHSPLTMEAFANIFDRISSKYNLNVLQVQTWRGIIWSRLARAFANSNDADNCERAARMVDNVVRPFSGSIVFEHFSAQAWSAVADAAATAGDADNAERAARIVDEIAESLTDQQAINLERVRAWRSTAVAFGNIGDFANAERTARIASDVADLYSGDDDFQHLRAEAWCAVVHGYGVAGNVENAENVTRLLHQISEPFMTQQRFGTELAEAWCFVSLAAANRGDPTKAEQAAKLVVTVSEQFLGSRELSYQCARAWRFVAFASGTKGDAINSERAACAVDGFAEPFGRDDDFQLERAFAWAAVAYGSSNDTATAQRAARIVDQIAAPLASKEQGEYARSEAWLRVVHAFERSGDSENAERIARVVAEIGELTKDKRIKLNIAKAWCFVARAYGRMGDKINAKRAALVVGETSLAFRGISEFDKQNELAWSFAADTGK
jgi:hypothetical protein